MELFVSNYFEKCSGENLQKNHCIISFDSVSYFVFVMFEHALIRNDVVSRAAQYWWMFCQVLVVGCVYRHVMMHVK
jgi:hypothetical protein